MFHLSNGTSEAGGFRVSLQKRDLRLGVPVDEDDKRTLLKDEKYI